jgi:peptide deformylase
MACLTIKKIPNKCLRKKAAEVKKVTDEDKRLLLDMAETMYLNAGVGLAATQVGINKQIAVIDVGKGLVKLINPSLVKKDGFECQEEGCLSVPKVTVKVKRSKKVVIDFLNEDGIVCRVAADGLFARAIQHEMDHLSGKLIIDYMGPVKKLIHKIKHGRVDKIEKI